MTSYNEALGLEAKFPYSVLSTNIITFHFYTHKNYLPGNKVEMST